MATATFPLCKLNPWLEIINCACGLIMLLFGYFNALYGLMMYFKGETVILAQFF